MHEDRTLRLKLLQEELLSIKQHYGKDATLRKVAPPGAAFPVLLKMHVEPPPFVTARYDVSATEVVLTLSSSILCAPPLANPQALEGQLSPSDHPDSPMVSTSTGGGAASTTKMATDKERTVVRKGVQDQDRSCTGTCAKDWEDSWQNGLSVDVRCAELPKELRARIAARLHAHWVARVQSPNQTGLALALPAEEMRAQFLSLITIIPELVEGYETVDASGGTVRRFLIAGQQQAEETPTAAASHPQSAPERGTPAAPAGMPHTQTTPPSEQQHSHGKNNSHAARSPDPCKRGTQSQQGVQARDSCPTSPAVRQASHAEAAHKRGCVGVQRMHIKSKGAVASDPKALQDQTKRGPAAAGGAGSVQGPGERVGAEGGRHGMAVAAKVLWGELQYLQRRFGAAFWMVKGRDGQGGGEGRRVGHLQQLAGTPEDLSSCSGFELELQPTDPAWERGPVMLLCELAPVPQPASTHPAASDAMAEGTGSPAPAATSSDGAAHTEYSQRVCVSVRKGEQDSGSGQVPHAAQQQAEGREGRVDSTETMERSRDGVGGGTSINLSSLCMSPATPLPFWLRSHFDEALAKQVCSPAIAQPMGLRSIIRQLENYGGQLALQAEQAARAAGVRTNLGQGANARDACSSSSSSSSDGTVASNADSNAEDSEGGDSDVGEEALNNGGGPPSDEDGYSNSSSDGSWYGDLGGVRREDGGDMGQGLPSQECVPGGKYGSSAADMHVANQFENGDGRKQKGAEVEGGHGHAGAACAEADDEGHEEEDNRDEVAFRGGGGEGESADGGRAEVAAFHLVLEALKLDLVSAVEALKAVIQVRCGRCSTPSALSLSSDAVAMSGTEGPSTSKAPFQASSVCQNCRSSFQASMRTKFVHDTNNVLLVLKPVGCYPLDLLPSLLAAQCSCCSAVMSLRNVQVGMPYERTCSSCHQRLSLHIPAVSFVPISQGPRGSSSNRGSTAVNSRMAMAAAKKGGLRGALAAFNGVLQLGQPLPGLGTCKHYHHSHRWLRFPCCGMRYPCDLCHEELSVDGHGARWAQRMVCGYCSVEQALGSQCKHCGKKLASSAKNPSGRNTRYWEGGEGCRDKTRMTRSDPHKYRDSKAKTKSKKQSRVGEKPWSKMKKNEQKTHYQSSK